MSSTLKQELCDLFDVSTELVNEVSDTLETIHEGKYKIGDVVTVNRGPHKNDKHTVFFVHRDGKLNLKPNVWPVKRIRYRLGGVTVTPDEVKMHRSDDGRPQKMSPKEREDLAAWRQRELALSKTRRHGTLASESLDEQDLPFGLESFQGPVSNAEMNRKKDTVAKTPNTEQDNTSDFDPTKKSSSQKEAEREKKLRAKMDDKVENDMLDQHNTKDDEVTFYPSTEHGVGTAHSSERKLGI